MINAEWLYWLVGTFFVVVTIVVATQPGHVKRAETGAFWGLLGLSFFYSTFVQNQKAPAWILGIAVLTMVTLTGFGFTGSATKVTDSSEDDRAELAASLRNKRLVPALGGARPGSAGRCAPRWRPTSASSRPPCWR